MVVWMALSNATNVCDTGKFTICIPNIPIYMDNIVLIPHFFSSDWTFTVTPEIPSNGTHPSRLHKF